MANRHLTVFALLGSCRPSLESLCRRQTLRRPSSSWSAITGRPGIRRATPEGAKVHTVVPGDTFWALAATNLGNPYLWPQIWEKNQYVLDAHWIYPGDPLVLDLAGDPPSPRSERPRPAKRRPKRSPA